MHQVLLLQTIYKQRNTDPKKASPLKQITDAYINDLPLDGRLIEQAIADLPEVANAGPLELVDYWRNTLVLLLVLNDKDLLQVCSKHLEARIRRLHACSLWKGFQLVSIYEAIGDYLLHNKVQKIEIQQYASGACPTEWEGCLSWGEIPQPILHAELGVLLCLYGHLTGEQQCVEAAKRLSDWQLNTLDHEFFPFNALFTYEKVAAKHALLINNFLLFDAVSRCSERPDTAFIAGKQLDYLASLSESSSVDISPLSAVIERWFGIHTKPIASVSHRLPPAFEDSHTAFTACRHLDRSAAATLFGGGSGMGSFHREDLQIVNYGPQYLPLGDCRGFGLEGGSRVLSTHIKTIAATSQKFLLEGMSRMGGQSGIWLDVKQKFEEGDLDIETDFQTLFDLPPLAFVFFVKANHCLINENQVVKPRSFFHYKGSVGSIQLQGNQIKMSLSAGHNEGEMEVIPLGGGDNFWGADFLIAYHMVKGKSKYCWKVQ